MPESDSGAMRRWQKALRISKLASSMRLSSTVPSILAPFRLSDRPSHRDTHGEVQILIVGCAAEVSSACQTFLVDAGHTAVVIEDAVEAVRFIAEGGLTIPDVVMVDFQLEAQRVVAFLRRSYTPVHLPIVLLGPFSDALIDSVTPAINDYIFTPPKGKDLLARVALQLKLHDTMKLDAEAVLLRRVLPCEVIARMQAGRDGEFIADSHDNLTFLFADLVSFTEMCSVTPTTEVVSFLNTLFTHFDHHVDRHGVYKVDIIGDAYFIVSGHNADPDEPAMHARNMLRMAESMLQVAGRLQLPTPVAPGHPPLPVRLRIGMHSGPAYAGVIGLKQPRYTFFGDTVNTASRMESTGHPLCVHMSGRCKEQLVSEGEPEGSFAFAGRTKVKGKGLMETYFARVGDWEAGVIHRVRHARAEEAAAAAAAAAGARQRVAALGATSPGHRDGAGVQRRSCSANGDIQAGPGPGGGGAGSLPSRAQSCIVGSSVQNGSGPSTPKSPAADNASVLIWDKNRRKSANGEALTTGGEKSPRDAAPT